ncbi:MAG: pentapeptide repeat-containing protein [Candidatus Thiodiazotropha sp. (ex Troendleina suluensis)]|nr:pentapeptide repeat-containing protein [Candidatus Thiodiazotropha sp. (ex Troendleina suluensis)]
MSDPYRGQDFAFGSQRLDRKTILNADYKHCTFANLSFFGAKVQDGGFLNCVFIGCYFRRAELQNVRFTGCRFIDCNFSHVSIKSCDFRHSIFRGCQLPFAEFAHSLPSEPNLREEITRNLAIESVNLGLGREARDYRMAEIRAHEEHLLSAVRGSSNWYREHFDFLRRTEAFVHWLLSLLNRWLWGYGERAWVLVRNLLLVSVVIFPVFFYLLRDQLDHVSHRTPGIWEIVHFSFENVIPAGVESHVAAVGNAARVLAGIESLLGVIAIALFASYIFRWSLHR